MPSRIGRFQLKEVLRKTDGAVLYRVWDPSSKNDYALMEFEPDQQEDGFLERLHDDFRRATGLVHANVVRAFDWISDPPCIVMEYCEGGDLEYRLNSRRPLQLNEVLGIAEGIAQGLIFLHGNDPPIAHGALVPANVLFKGTTIKIACLDAGRKANQGSLRVDPMTDRPRDWKDESAVSSAREYWQADLQALGVMLYQMLTWQHPWEGRGRTAVAFPPWGMQPPPWEIPEPFERILRRALGRDSDQCYDSARDFLEDLKQVRGSLRGMEQLVPPRECIHDADLWARDLCENLEAGRLERAEDKARRLGRQYPANDLGRYWLARVRLAARNRELATASAQTEPLEGQEYDAPERLREVLLEERSEVQAATRHLEQAREEMVAFKTRRCDAIEHFADLLQDIRDAVAQFSAKCSDGAERGEPSCLAQTVAAVVTELASQADRSPASLLATLGGASERLARALEDSDDPKNPQEEETNSFAEVVRRDIEGFAEFLGNQYEGDSCKRDVQRLLRDLEEIREHEARPEDLGQVLERWAELEAQYWDGQMASLVETGALLQKALGLVQQGADQGVAQVIQAMVGGSLPDDARVGLEQAAEELRNSAATARKHWDQAWEQRGRIGEEGLPPGKEKSFDLLAEAADRARACCSWQALERLAGDVTVRVDGLRGRLDLVRLRSQLAAAGVVDAALVGASHRDRVQLKLVAASEPLQEVACFAEKLAQEVPVDEPVQPPPVPDFRVRRLNQRLAPEVWKCYEARAEEWRDAESHAAREERTRLLVRLTEAYGELLCPPPLWPRVVTLGGAILLLLVIGISIIESFSEKRYVVVYMDAEHPSQTERREVEAPDRQVVLEFDKSNRPQPKYEDLEQWLSGAGE